LKAPLFHPKKNRYQPGADNGFCIFSVYVAKPLSTPFLAAAKNADDEDNKNTDKVDNGESAFHNKAF
jgi:hypothetical protein